MTDSSPGKKKIRIKIAASSQGIEKAERALIRLGFESKINFAKSQSLASSTVTKFFQRKPIQVDSFQRICDALTLNWKEIIELEEEKKSVQLKTNDCSNTEFNEEVEQVQTLRRQMTVTDGQNGKTKLIITLEGDINSVTNSKILESILREHSGDSINITDIKEGSIKLTLEGNSEDIKRLVSSIKSGKLKELNGFPVEEVQIFSDSLDDEEIAETNDKWRLVEEIVTQSVLSRNLQNVDLSDAYLRGAYLRGAYLRGAYLRGAYLSDAYLRGADLRGADLSDAYLSDAYLSGADLRSAYLSDADLSDAYLSGADLRSADLSGAYLSGADLSGADLSGADLSESRLVQANLTNTRLNSANLVKANLIGADLSNVQLLYADLTDADLSGATVENAHFKNNLGISESLQRYLKERGAIFEDSPPGDRSEVLTPV